MQDFRGLLSAFYDFYIVAQAKSFSLASKKHNLSSSNLSRSVKNLENSLDLSLINSNNKGFTLTLDGEKLYKELDVIFSKLTVYIQNYINDTEILMGTITIGTTRNIADNLLNQYLSAFHQKFPKIKINIFTDSASNLNEYLLNHKIDVLIDYMQQINFSEKYDLRTTPIGGFDTCFACSESFYKANHNDIKSIKDLKKYNLVVSGASRRRQILDSFLNYYNIDIAPICEMPDSKLMAEFIKKNDCIGYFIQEEVEAYGLTKLPISEELPRNEIGITYYKDTMNNITKKFVELVLQISKNNK